jgi:hypothetical protein
VTTGRIVIGDGAFFRTASTSASRASKGSTSLIGKVIGRLSARLLVLSALRKPVRVQKEGVMNSGIGNYVSSTTNSMCAVSFVEAGTSQLLLTHRNDSSIPRIGETILIRKDGRPDRSYQVRDVVWEFIWNADCSWLKDVVVILMKENHDNRLG